MKTFNWRTISLAFAEFLVLLPASFQIVNSWKEKEREEWEDRRKKGDVREEKFRAAKVSATRKIEIASLPRSKIEEFAGRLPRDAPLSQTLEISL